MTISTGWRRWFGVILVGVVGCGIAAHARPWQRLESKDLIIVSDASAKDVLEFAVGYSAYRQALSTLFGQSGVAIPPARILLFRNLSDLHKYTPAPAKKDYRLLTFTGEVDSSAFIAMAIDGDRSEALEHAYEFDTIWGLRRMGYALPVWMTQGTGEVLTTLRVEKNQIVLGETPSRFSSISYSGRFIPWSHFFDIAEGSKEYSGRLADGTYHAQAWQLMHWMLFGKGNGSEVFKKVAAKLATKRSLDAVCEVFGVDEAKLAKAIDSDKWGRETEMKLPFDTAALRSSLAVKPGAEAEAKVFLSDLLAIAQDTVGSERELQAAVRLAPDSVWVLEAQGRQAYRHGDSRAASEFYQKAIERGSSNPHAFLAVAKARLDESSNGGADFAGNGGSNVTAALGHIRKALELDPGSAEAFTALGRAFFLAQKVSDADKAELARGVTPESGSSAVRNYYALLCDRLGDKVQRDEQWRLIVADPQTPSYLRDQVQRNIIHSEVKNDFDRINALSKEQKFAEALAVVEAARNTPRWEASSRDYLRVERDLTEAKTWSAVYDDYKTQRWEAAAEGARAFLKAYPNSRARDQAKTVEAQATRRLQKPNASAIPASATKPE